MANVLTSLAADIYIAADIVGRELVGFIPSCTVNRGSERVAQNDVVRSAFTRAATVNTTYTPSMTIPEGDDQTVDNKTLTINKAANVKIPWTGEDVAHVDNGYGFSTLYGDQILQAFRGISNQIENDLWVEAYQNASRAFGTPATTPFGSNFDEVAEIRQILVDNGMPDDGMTTLVLNTKAGTNLRQLAQLQKANEAGGTQLLRQGILLDLQGLMIKESAKVGLHTAGTGAGYLLDGALAVGGTTVTVDTGTGTIVKGDIVTFAGTADKYVVNTALSGTTFAIGSPGSRVLEANNDAVTVGAAYTANVAFHRSALEIAVRPPKMPYQGRDAADDRITVTDEHSGLTFEVAVYLGYGKVMFDITSLYGVKAWKPDFIANLIG